jgi:hypothetical protein
MVFSVRVSVPGKSLVSPQELTLPTGTDGGVHFMEYLIPCGKIEP